MFAIKSQLEKIFLLVLSLMKLRLRLSDPLKLHPKQEPFNKIRVMKYYCEKNEAE